MFSANIPNLFDLLKKIEFNVWGFSKDASFFILYVLRCKDFIFDKIDCVIFSLGS